MKTTVKTTTKKKVDTALTHDQLVEARDRLFELKEVQAEAREEELRIRVYLADRLFDAEEGSKTFTVEGVKVTVTRSLSRTIGRDEAERFTQEYPKLSLECLRWKAELRVGEYKKNNDIMDGFIVTKAGPPTIEFK